MNCQRRDATTNRNPEQNSVFVRNLAYAVSEAQLLALAKEFGEATGARIPFDGDRQRSRGFAFISCLTPDDRDAIVTALDGRQFAGRTLRAEVAVAGYKHGAQTRFASCRSSSAQQKGSTAN